MDLPEREKVNNVEQDTESTREGEDHGEEEEEIDIPIPRQHGRLSNLLSQVSN